MTHDSPPAAPTSSPLAQLFHLCQQLHNCSDEDLHDQLQEMACTQPEQLVQPVRLLLHSSQYVDQQLGAPEAASATSPAPPIALLSPREREVLNLLAQGHTMPRIAERLFISAATVNNHCAKMREKLGLRGRNALLLFAGRGDKK